MNDRVLVQAQHVIASAFTTAGLFVLGISAWHLIGPGLWTNQQNLSIVYPTAPATFAGQWVGVNTYEQNLVAYNA